MDEQVDLSPLMTSKIVKARISDLKRVVQMPAVYVTVEGSSQEVKLFEFYPDEITFQAEEFVGKTVREAYDLRRERDVAYLRS